MDNTPILLQDTVIWFKSDLFGNSDVRQFKVGRYY
ncbi:hypothetical protein BVRB_3g065320 [Beta vulgaris subsp. vulgaris]|uniref:Uncharacterized protein n=1 Tax=Beta vulgaris subsp. vulgaris TaxID=3555 RepID=A0A0J8CMP9_BETVV|nr:hypothetical protein BVRB_3g065320 [Beta vulgaris subsp. vulgaris]